jgi:hypothetical protein
MDMGMIKKYIRNIKPSQIEMTFQANIIIVNGLYFIDEI